MKLLVTGGAVFICSAVVRTSIAAGRQIVNVDKLTYAANLDTLASVADNSLYQFETTDICNAGAMVELLAKHNPGAIMHLAAESHVDRSIDQPSEFIQTISSSPINCLKFSCNTSTPLKVRKKTTSAFVMSQQMKSSDHWA
jgi:dTDP-glucose 4,6-dehydratase